MEKVYALEEDNRTGHVRCSEEVRHIIRPRLKLDTFVDDDGRRHVRCWGRHQFVRVRADGSGQAWNEWPDRGYDEYPAGHFPAEVRPMK